MIRTKPGDAIGLLQMIYDRRMVSQAGLADEMNLSRSYVNSMVKGLRAAGLLKVVGAEESRGGRRRVLFEVNPELAHLIAVDLGTVNLRVVRTDLFGRMLSSKRIPSGLLEGQDAVLKKIHAEIRSLVREDSRVRGIGISQSGVINRATGELLFWPKVPGWRNVPLKQIIETEHNLPTIVDDSARTMAVAEQHFGEAQGLSEFLHVSIGAGIGSAIFTNGRLHCGSDGFAGELGHITIDEHGEICSCGNHGCLEVCASARAIISQAKTRLQKGVDSLILQLVEGDLERISVEVVVEAARVGDKLAAMILREVAEHLGTALADAVNLLNPSKIILGGAVPKAAGNLLTDPLLVTLRERALPQVTQNLEVVISSLSDESAAIGAAILAAQSLIVSEASLRQLATATSTGQTKHAPAVQTAKPRPWKASPPVG